MPGEEEIADVYEDFLNKQDDIYLIKYLALLFGQTSSEEKPPVFPKLEDYERNQIIQIILNIDWTGKSDCGFEDVRKSISTNDSCG